MASILMGMFKDNASAQEAVGELLLSGFLLDQINLFSPHATSPESDRAKEPLASELRREAGMDSFFRSLASAFTDYDELTVMSEADRQERVVMTIYADTEDKANRAAGIIDRYSQIDINDYYSPAGGAHQFSLIDTDTPRSLKGAMRSGKVLVLPDEPSNPTDRAPNP